MSISANGLKRFSLLIFVFLMASGVQIFKVSAEIEEPETKEETTEPVTDEERKGASLESSTFAHIPLRVVQFCQGKYQKKGIGGTEIITVQCPEAASTCNCEVTKKNLKERVNCGGIIKYASNGSNLESCHSQIVGN